MMRFIGEPVTQEEIDVNSHHRHHHHCHHRPIIIIIIIITTTITSTSITTIVSIIFLIITLGLDIQILQEFFRSYCQGMILFQTQPFSVKCDLIQEGLYGVYAEVGDYRNWIDTTISSNGGATFCN